MGVRRISVNPFSRFPFSSSMERFLSMRTRLTINTINTKTWKIFFWFLHTNERFRLPCEWKRTSEERQHDLQRTLYIRSGYIHRIRSFFFERCRATVKFVVQCQLFRNLGIDSTCNEIRLNCVMRTLGCNTHNTQLNMRNETIVCYLIDTNRVLANTSNIDLYLSSSSHIVFITYCSKPDRMGICSQSIWL